MPDTTAMSPASDLSDRDIRQRSLVPPEKLAAANCLVIGAGAVGRQVALQLAALGVPKLTLIDHDLVEVVNLATQGYAPDQLGLTKVAATGADCLRVNPQLQLMTFPAKFVRTSPQVLPCFGASESKPAVFCCVDSIDVRKVIWNAVRTRAAFWADGRMSGEALRVLASVDPAVDPWYSQTLFSRSEAFAGACTARGTIYTACIAAGFLLTQYTHWLRGAPVCSDFMVNLGACELIVNAEAEAATAATAATAVTA